MYKSVDLNLVANHVKIIYESIRCNICDKVNGKRVRYSCGHTSCEECVDAAGSCILCLTPPRADSAKPVVDEPLTRRTENACLLLKTFQNCFKLNVLNRQRQSEVLKIEKELFPQCIQAPSKYYNKRKSSLNLSYNKENTLSPFPGQEVYKADHKMENSNQNVEQWINKYIKRKPFTELNPNDQASWGSDRNCSKHTAKTPLPKGPRKRLQNENKLNKSKSSTVYLEHAKKRKLNENIQTKKLSKSFHKNKKSVSTTETKKSVSTTETKKSVSATETKKSESTATTINSKSKNNVNDESGIVMDDDAVVVIDDSQSAHIDKDLKAWLAVQQAENNDTFFTLSPTFSENSHDNNLKVISKIPFYKKGNLIEKCKYCKDFETNKNSSDLKKNKNISITIDNKNFTAVINVSHIDYYLKHSKKHSVEIQTDVNQTNDYLKNNHEQNNNEVFANEVNFKVSQDLFLDNDEKLNVEQKMNQNVVIEESDSDEDLGESLSLEVAAEVHRSCEQIDYDVLGSVENLEEHSKRQRRAARGLTPTSTDSSEKENYDPNRMRKTNHSKKKFKK